MQLFETSKVALKSLNSNRLRSTLTIVGIIVGIFSIISISTVIAMLQTSIEDGVSALGKNTFQVQKWPAVGNGTQNWAAIRNRKDISYEDYLRLKSLLTDARYVTQLESENGRNVIVLGSSVAESLFPRGGGLNEYVKVKGRKFKVIGILEQQGSFVMGNFNPDNMAYIPID